MNWLIGTILLFLALFGAYTGYLLPMDQSSYWAIQTGMELIGRVPGLGATVHELLVPDGVGGPFCLLRFYALHSFVIPFISFLFIFLHLYRLRKDRGVLPYL